MTTPPGSLSGPAPESGRAALEGALRSAGRGWPVLPLRGKQPAGSLAPHAAYSATTDPATIRSWFDDHRVTGYGVAGGRGLLLVDIDPRRGGSLDTLAAKVGPLPETFTVETGRGDGGFHLYFACQAPVGSGEPVAGVDVKGDGQYVVGPGSVHPDTGRRYRVARDIPPAPAPEGLLAVLSRRPRRTRRGPEPAWWQATLAAPGSDRSAALWKVFISGVARGWSDRALLERVEGTQAAGHADGKPDPRGWLEQDLARARTWVENRAAITAGHDDATDIEGHRQAVARATWRSSTALKLITAAQDESEHQGGGVFTFPRGRAACVASCADTTAGRHLRALVDEGWLKLVSKGKGKYATRYRLAVPERPTPDTYPPTPNSVTGRGANLAAHVPTDHDAARWGALGNSQQLVGVLDTATPTAVVGLPDLLGCSARTARRHVAKLVRHGLVIRVDRHHIRLTDGWRDQLDLAARSCGTHGQGAAQLKRYEQTVAARRRARVEWNAARQADPIYTDSDGRACRLGKGGELVPLRGQFGETSPFDSVPPPPEPPDEQRRLGGGARMTAPIPPTEMTASG